jgi:very-short-patch-repair endonuclease
MEKKSHYLKHTARKLRNNATEAEHRLWQYLKRKKVKDLQFYRQRPLGKYIVDFYCPKIKMVIEVDGGQHYENGEMVKSDIEREDYLKNILGLRVLRFTNMDILKNLSAVMDRILEEVRKLQIPLNPPFPKGETPTKSLI